LRFFLVSKRCWRNIFINYVDSLSSSIFIDIIYRYILVFVNCFIKIRHLVFTTSIKVEEVVNCFYIYVWKYYRLLEFFVSNRDIQFIFDIWKYLCQILKIDAKLVIAYYFEIDDQIEQVNTIIEYYLCVFVNYMQNNWTK